MDKTSKKGGTSVDLPDPSKGPSNGSKVERDATHARNLVVGKKECPLINSAQASSSGTSSKEVMLMENRHDPAVKQIWEPFVIEDYAKTNQVCKICQMM